MPTSFWYNSDSLFLQKSHTAAAKTRFVVHLDRMGDKRLDIGEEQTAEGKNTNHLSSAQLCSRCRCSSSGRKPSDLRLLRSTPSYSACGRPLPDGGGGWGEQKNSQDASTTGEQLFFFGNACEPEKDSLSRTLSALLSPRMGSNILSRGLDSCCSR